MIHGDIGAIEINVNKGALVILSSLSNLALWWNTGNTNSAIAGLTIFSIIPWTFLLMAPLVNNKLFALNEKAQKDPKPELLQKETNDLVNLWSLTHGYRTTISFVSLVFAIKSLH